VSFNDEHGTAVNLTKDDVVKYISTDETVTDNEVVQFLNMCKYLRLNPFLKEIYLIKYKGSPATYVVSYQSFLMRAEENPNFDGYETAIEGKVPDLTATATVYRKDRAHPVTVTVSYGEAVKTVNNSPACAWKNMPAWMLRKVALARALKEAFPTAVGNIQVAMNDGGDINSNDRTVQEARKSLPDANEVLYGIPDEKPEAENSNKAEPPAEQAEQPIPAERPQEALYVLMTEKNIRTLREVKEVLKKVLPDGRWNSIDKKVFENMTDEAVNKVIEYLKK